LSGSDDRTIRVWNSTDGTSKLNITSQNLIYALITLQPNDDIVSAGTDFKIRVWNLTDGTIKFTLSGHSSIVTRLATLSNGDLVSASIDQTIKVWNLTDKSFRLDINIITCNPYALTILSDDEIVSGCDGGNILIHLSNGTLKQNLNAFGYVNALVTYPNDVIVSAADDFTVRFWTNN
jgi:WD40 repeat protein